MSGNSYNDNAERSRRLGEYASNSTAEDASAYRRRVAERAKSLEVAPPPKVDVKRTEQTQQQDQGVDLRLAKNTFTAPPSTAKEVHLLLVDNSASNRQIAEALKYAAGYMLSMFAGIAPQGVFGLRLFSDHCDGPLLFQDVNFVVPGPAGEQVLRASLKKTRGADGGDYPEAIECALNEVCDLDFGSVSRPNRHLYLVSDQVAHGMMSAQFLADYGWTDSGCPNQCHWGQAVKRAHQSFGTFQMVGCGSDPRIAALQAQFISPERRCHDFVDLSTVENTTARQRIVGNMVLFLAARNKGGQLVEAFLKTLYEKWLEDPLYGALTAVKAAEQIRNFAAYLEGSPEHIKQMLNRILPPLDE